jgi:ABC-type sugar transport system ATPase subunit
MSDRIAMLHEGTIGGIFTKAEATAEKLMAAALGHTSAGKEAV